MTRWHLLTFGLSVFSTQLVQLVVVVVVVVVVAEESKWHKFVQCTLLKSMSSYKQHSGNEIEIYIEKVHCIVCHFVAILQS